MCREEEHFGYRNKVFCRYTLTVLARSIGD
jgi:hypothetical protein